MSISRISTFVFAVVFAAVSCFGSEGGEVLWWTVGTDYKNITGAGNDGKEYTAGELGVTDARIRYEAEDGSTGYLTMLGLNEDGTVSVYDGSAGLGAEYGMGVPAEYFGRLSDLSGTAYYFVLELGNYLDGEWAHTSMESERVSYDSLLADGHIDEWTGTPPVSGSPWSPGGYTVIPEPSGVLLVLVGSAFLALRRKRRVL